VRYDIGAAFAGIVFTLLGTSFLLDALDVATFRYEIILPIVVIAVGLAAILSALLRPKDA
jgi:hypothetical protein